MIWKIIQKRKFLNKMELRYVALTTLYERGETFFLMTKTPVYTSAQTVG